MRRLNLLLATLLICGGAAHAETVTVELKVRGGDDCLELRSGYQSGAGLRLAACNGDARQLFRVRPNGAGHELRSVASGQCLDAPPGTRVQQYPCHGGATQQWDFELSPWAEQSDLQSADHGFVLRNAHTGGFLGDDYDNVVQTSDSRAVELDLTVAQMGTSGTYIDGSLHYTSGALSLRNTARNGQCLDVPGSRVGRAYVQGAYECNGGDNQRWSFRSARRGEFEIVAGHSRQCLDVPPYDAPAIYAQQYPCHHGANQRFQMRYMGNDLVDVRTLRGQCLGLHTYGGNWLIAGDCQDVWSRWRLGPALPVAGPPQLMVPAHGATVPSKPEFDWAGSPFAEDYLLCVARPGVSCPTHEVPVGTNPGVVVVRTRETAFGPRPAPVLGVANPGLDLLQFADSTVNWTVASCQNGRCAYQQSVRTMHVVPQWQVDAVLENVMVRDDCDNVSDGEWRLAVLLSAGLRADADLWSNNSVDVGNNAVRSVSAHLSGVRANQSVRLSVGGVECDNDGVWAILSVFSGIPGLIGVVQDRLQTCGFEEAAEWSGDNDDLGSESYSLSPAQWQAGGRYWVRASDGCGDYTAHFRVGATRR